VAKAGQVEVQGLVDEDLARRVVQMVVAPDDVGDAHGGVVHHHGQVVGGRAVAPAQHHVVEFGIVDGHRPLDHVVDQGGAGDRRLEPHHPARAGAKAGLAAAAGILGLQPLLPSLFAHGLDFLGRARAPVGVAGLQHLVDVFIIQIEALALVGDLAVVVQAQPRHGVQDRLGHVGLGALEVGVLDAQEKGAAEMAGQEPVENGRARAADMQVAGGAWGEAGDDGAHGGLRTPGREGPGRRLA